VSDILTTLIAAPAYDGASLALPLSGRGRLGPEVWTLFREAAP
jgi:hypothetical protein